MMGTVIKRGNSYVLVRDYGKDPTTGKRRRKWQSFDTEREALLKQAQWATHPAVGAGVGVYGSTRLRVGDFLDRWLSDYAKVFVKPRTYEGYEQYIASHVKPRLGHVPLAKLAPAMLQTLFADLLKEGRKAKDRRGAAGKGLSRTTVHHIGTMLRLALKHAVEWEITEKNPADKAKIPARATPVLDLWSEEQAIRFLVEAYRSAKYPLFYDLAMNEGFRAGDLLSLRWQDIDFIDTGLAKIHVRDGKTDNARRTVEVTGPIVARLREQRGLGLVFKTKRGTPLSLNNVRFQDFWPTVKRAGVPRIRIHDLRHFNASYLLGEDVDIATVSSRIGHSSKAFTLRTYAHVMSAGQEKATAAANRLREKVAAAAANRLLTETAASAGQA